jgi:hypothetical protein
MNNVALELGSYSESLAAYWIAMDAVHIGEPAEGLRLLRFIDRHIRNSSDCKIRTILGPRVKASLFVLELSMGEEFQNPYSSTAT